MRYLLTLLSFCFCIALIAQETVDGSFQVQKTDKKYSIYVPSGYDAATPQPLMIGFHPLNVNRWDGESWRDTLIQFAETNQLLLACPDGGLDGRIDDPIDTTFTTLLIDSLHQWYNIDVSNQYAIGFSWGARTAYSYGMNHPGTFKGVIPIGAAIDGTAQFNEVLSSATQMVYYIVHGSNDSPSIRYTPVINAFDNMEVCYDTQLLPGVGHTIDFPMRNEILTEAFAFVSNDLSCLSSSNEELRFVSDIKIFPNPATKGIINIENSAEQLVDSYQLFDISGKLIHQYQGTQTKLRTNNLPAGVFILKILHESGQFEFRKVLIED